MQRGPFGGEVGEQPQALGQRLNPVGPGLPVRSLGGLISHMAHDIGQVAIMQRRMARPG